MLNLKAALAPSSVVIKYPKHYLLRKIASNTLLLLDFSFEKDNKYSLSWSCYSKQMAGMWISRDKYCRLKDKNFDDMQTLVS